MTDRQARSGGAGDASGPAPEAVREPGPEQVAVGIVLERRKSRHPWQDYAWKVAAAIAGAPPRDPHGAWLTTAEGEDWTHYHAGTLTLTVYPGEAEGYRLNLLQQPPRLFVLLRRTQPGAQHELAPFHVTACPFEAQEYLDGDELVETVTMPLTLVGFLQDFVERCPLPPAFHKRKRKRWREGQGAGGQGGEGHGGGGRGGGGSAGGETSDG